MYSFQVVGCRRRRAPICFGAMINVCYLSWARNSSPVYYDPRGRVRLIPTHPTCIYLFFYTYVFIDRCARHLFFLICNYLSIVLYCVVCVWQSDNGPSELLWELNDVLMQELRRTRYKMYLPASRYFCMLCYVLFSFCQTGPMGEQQIIVIYT